MKNAPTDAPIDVPPLDADLRALIELAEGDPPPMPPPLVDDVHRSLQTQIARPLALSAKSIALGGTATLVVAVGVVVAALGTTSRNDSAISTAPATVASAPALAERDPPPAPAPAPETATPAAPAPAPSAPAASPTRVARRAPAPVAPAQPAESEARVDGAAERELESALLEKARAALRAWDLGDAAEILDEHARTWPDGAFVEEADALRALLAVRSGAAGAREQVDAFTAKHPGSVYNAMLREALRSVSAPADR